MSYQPGNPPSDATDLKVVAEFLRREFNRIAATIADDADRIEYLPDVLTPAQLTGATDDYAPSGMESANVLRISANAPINLTGLKNPAPGKPRRLVLMNVSANTITLVNASVASAAANRFALPGAANLAITQNQARTLWYDCIASNWKALS